MEQSIAVRRLGFASANVEKYITEACVWCGVLASDSPCIHQNFGAHECRGREQKSCVEGTGCMQDLCCIALVTTVEIGVELGACRHAHIRFERVV